MLPMKLRMEPADRDNNFVTSIKILNSIWWSRRLSTLANVCKWKRVIPGNFSRGLLLEAHPQEAPPVSLLIFNERFTPLPPRGGTLPRMVRWGTLPQFSSTSIRSEVLMLYNVMRGSRRSL